MGGNRFKRIDYSDDEINDLFEKYKMNNNKFISLFSGKNKTNYRLWKYDLAINMSRTSKCKLQHLINDYENKVPSCSICRSRLTVYELDETINRYKNHCNSCIKHHTWAKRENLESDKLIERGKKISKSKKEFYATDYGKETAKNIGKKNTTSLKEYFKTEEGINQLKLNSKRQSKIMKEKIANGKFTPNITNSRTHWKAEIVIDGNIVKFRSSWEACVWYCNRQLEYESFRIPYFKNNTNSTYIADFFDKATNTLYEIKPKSQWLKVNDKMQQILTYCLLNNIKFVWINENNILNFVDKNLFDSINIKQYNKMIKGLK